jgi:excisionase family DNA binding protein
MVGSQIKQDESIERQLRVSKVAELLDISRASVYDLIRAGELKAIKVGSRLRVPVSSVQLLIERAKVA